MDTVSLLETFMGLTVILAILLFLFFRPTKGKQENKRASVAPSQEAAPSLEMLRQKIRNKQSSAKELSHALELVLKHYGVIHAKMGVRSHGDFDIYRDILFTICRHPNTTKDIIINFDRELSKKNPEYRAEIDEAITKGLNSRGS